MYQFRLIILLLSLSILNTSTPAQSLSFIQEIKRDIVLPAAAGTEIVALFKRGDSPFVVTKTGIYQLQGDNWILYRRAENTLAACQDGDGGIWTATQTDLTDSNGKSHHLPKLADGEHPTYLKYHPNNGIWLGTNQGIYLYNNGWIKETLPATMHVKGLDFDNKGRLWAASLNGMWLKEKSRWTDMDEHMMAVGHEGKYFSMTSTDDGDHIFFGSAWAVGRISANGDHWAARGNDGLPFGPATVIHPSGSTLWLGTTRGAIRYRAGEWQYYAGMRWLPTDEVTSILALDEQRTWIGTTGGISEIQGITMTLEKKADSIERVIDKRHNRLDLINRSKLREAGDLTTSYSDNEDNDGLWTSCYLVAQVFRYAATKDPGAKEKAKRTFEALERLETVTGISGYPARSYARASDTVTPSRSPHPKVWHPSPDGEWQWLDDTSSDEITGHVFAVSLYHDLVADAEEKGKAVDLVDRIVTNIIDNEFQLIDFDGLPTRWGIWHPDSLNNSPNWMFERGLNSLQILSFLNTAHRLTGNEKYAQTYNLLVEKHGYLENAKYAKIQSPFDISHSDDILNFFPYYDLIRTLPDTHPHMQTFTESLRRTWTIVQSDHMPVWNVFASALLEQDCDLDIAREEIQQFPMDLVNWKMENSHRWDLRRDYLPHRTMRDQADKPLRSPEANISRWNTNPKLMDVGEGGLTEDSGTFYLAAYWMGRYFGFWQ